MATRSLKVDSVGTELETVYDLALDFLSEVLKS